eukprot:3369569-Rhodomonas_salina.2
MMHSHERECEGANGFTGAYAAANARECEHGFLIRSPRSHTTLHTVSNHSPNVSREGERAYATAKIDVCDTFVASAVLRNAVYGVSGSSMAHLSAGHRTA